MQPSELVFIVLAGLYTTVHAEMRIVCYYANWSLYRHTNVPVLYPEDIDPSLCTHVHIAFARIDPQTLKIEPTEKHDTQWTDAFHTPLYLRMYGLKRRNSSLQLLLAVGGWTAGSEGFNSILTNDTTRANFIRHTKEFLTEWNFDGIDLDWEFPGDIKRGAKNESREQFNVLIKELHDSFHNDTSSSAYGTTRFLLTAAVSADPTKIDLGYVVPDLCRYLDYVSVMTYDYNGAWDNVTGINAPLYGLNDREENDDGRWRNVNASIHYWLDKGCPAEKLNLGLAIYGRSFTLANNTDSVSVGTDTIGGGQAGPFVKENGTLAYFEICQKLRLFNWTNVFDTDAQAPYAYSPISSSLDKQWVGYDNLKSVTSKVIYAKSLNLGGTMLWSIDQDDYLGLFCNQGLFPFTRRVRDALLSSDNYDDQEFVSSTSTRKTRTRYSTNAVPFHRQTPQHHRSKLPSTRSTWKSKTNHGVANHRSVLCIFFSSVFFVYMAR